MTQIVERTAYSDYKDYIMPEVLRENLQIKSYTYDRWLYNFNQKEFNKHPNLPWHNHLPEPDFHPAPLTYDQWFQIIKRMEIAVQVASDMGADIPMYDLFLVAFLEQDPDHAKFNESEINRYFLTL